MNGAIAPASRLLIPARAGAAPKQPDCLSTPKAKAISDFQEAISKEARATADDPLAEAFST